jgi:predicted dithiol-disulfide oxidoreductase (DUF899 family)
LEELTQGVCTLVVAHTNGVVEHVKARDILLVTQLVAQMLLEESTQGVCTLVVAHTNGVVEHVKA